MQDGQPKITLGAVLFDGFELLDLYGPLELLGLLEGRMDVVTIGERAGAIRSSQAPSGVADFSLFEDRAFDVLLVPGGAGTRRLVTDDRFLEAITRHARAAKYVASVCTGSAVLAKAGLLDGRRATSNKRAFAWVKSQGPKVDWVPQARWVEDGPFFSSSGVSAGMDMTLGLIQRLFDRDTSVRIAQRAEYEWHEDAGWDPFAKIHGLA